MRAILCCSLLLACTTPWSEQRDYARTLKPAEVVPAGPAPAAAWVRALRVRVYADAGYRAQTPRWNQRIEAQFERANAVLQRQFGVRLEIESVRQWERAAAPGSLAPVLEELTARDPGDDVDWVVGFVAPLDIVASELEQIGMAELFGRHLVLRGMFSAAETDAIDRSLNLLGAADRDALGRERRIHKETAALLHEWAHTLGAPHEDTPRDSLMTPAYDTAQSSFSPQAQRLVEIGLRYRSDFTAWEKAYRAAFEGQPERTRREALAAADEFFSARARGEFVLPREDAQRFREAVAKDAAGDTAGAAALLAPVAQRWPRLAPVQDYACTLASKRNAAEAPAVCASAAALPGVAPETAAVAAALLLAGGKRLEALRILQRAEAKPPAEARHWLLFAEQYQRASACFAAERAARKAGSLAGAAAIIASCAHLRHFVGFPRDPSALPPDREPDYVAAVGKAQEEIDSRRTEQALLRADDLRKAFPGTPGGALIECRARSRGRAIALTRAACSAAAEAAPDAFLPQYILGLVAAEEGRWKDAARSMRRAIQIDDGTPQVWASLAAVAVKLRDADAVHDLSVRYQERFRERLRPALWPAGWAAR